MWMKLIPITLFFASLFCSVQLSNAQSATQLQETARSFMQKGDFNNASLLFQRASIADPNNIEITKNLALSFYFQKEYSKGLDAIKSIIDKEESDDQCFQIAGNLYKQLEQTKECEKLLKKGIKKFPNSGALYNELGDLLWAQNNIEAIRQWEKGIENDPNYSKNYYNACKYYQLTADYVWSILYGEVFVNMEPLSKGSPEIKSIILESYKKIFSEEDIKKENSETSKFTSAFLKNINKQNLALSTVFNAETLTMIRTRFILDWSNEYASKYPTRLFDYQRQLIQEGMFEAYNQWLFGTVQNLTSYQNWISSHAEEYKEFTYFQSGRIFKVPQGQYYRLSK
jgi:tetratricopeptide (TPR) repeat protein